MRIKIPERVRQKWNALPLKKRQYAFVGAVLVGGFLLVWLMLTVGSDPKPKRTETVVKMGKSTNLGTSTIAVPGSVSPLDEWVGNAGRKLAQYESDKRAQEKINADREATEKRILERLDQLSKQSAAPVQSSSPVTPVQAPTPVESVVQPPPPPRAHTTSPAAGPLTMPPGTPSSLGPAETPPSNVPEAPQAPVIGRVTLGSAKSSALEPAAKGQTKPGAVAGANDRGRENVTKGDAGTFLPVGFARGELLGGLDAPTGGQSQSNPQPVLIRLLDNAILPNRFRAQVRECLVVAAGYGDISSERALFRTVSLSCVRHDGTVLETDLKGSVFGEDGKLGLRGRLVTKQGQMLANALRAGIVGGIGDGFARAGTTVTTGAFGNVASESGDMQQNMQRGVVRGVGKAMDQLADYYVRLAEKTFPIIEIDAARKVDVVITKGVYLPMSPGASTSDDEDAWGDRP